MSEAARDVAAGTTRALTLTVVLGLLLGAVAGADVRSVVSVLQDAHAYRTSGGAVQVLSSEAGIDGFRCHAMTGAPGVAAAAAVRQGPPTRVLALPSSNISTWEVTPGTPDLLIDVTQVAPGSGREGGAWVSHDLAQTLGTGPGGVVDTDVGPMTVAGVFTWPEDGRARTFGYSILTPVPATGTFAQCWAQVWPVDETSALLLRSTVVAGGDDQAGQTRLNTGRAATFDGPALVRERITAPAPYLALLIGLTLGWVAIRARRLEIAAALHARVPRPHLIAQHLLEALVWTSAATILAGALTAVLATLGNPDTVLPVATTGARTVLTGAAGAILGTVLGATTTREKHLFRYFKER